MKNLRLIVTAIMLAGVSFLIVKGVSAESLLSPEPTLITTTPVPTTYVANLNKVKITGINVSKKIITAEDNNSKPISIILTSSNVKYYRRFGGESNLDEFNVGDLIDVKGYWSDSPNTVVASVIHDISVAKGIGPFKVKILTIDYDNKSIQVITDNQERGTVYVSDDTRYVNSLGERMYFREVFFGDEILINGTWNAESNTVHNVNKIVDLSYPEK